MRLRDFVDVIRRREGATSTSFSIHPHRLLGSGSTRDAPAFVPGQTYFEIRSSQMYLQYDREWWRTFNPLGSFLAEFLFAGAQRTVPFVVGPELLEGAFHVKDGSRIEYQNIRVAGPYPYVGDELQLFAGLFRVETSNWANRALSLLETVAKAFDVTKLTSYITIAGPLVDGIQGLLGMEGVELRMGVDRAYTQPPDGAGPSALPREALQPAFQVLLNMPSERVPEAERRNFWVKDGRLFYGSDERTLREFRDADFLLLHLAPLAARDDYTTFDFHKTDWAKVEDHLVNGREGDAWQGFRLLAANLVQCEDLVPSHRERLLRQYRRWFEERRQLYRLLFEQPEELGFESGRRPSVVGEADLRGALEAPVRAAPAAPMTPERLLAQLDA